MKTAQQVTALVEFRLRNGWHTTLAPDCPAADAVAGEHLGDDPSGDDLEGGDRAGGGWPYRVALGAPSGAALSERFGEHRAAVLALRGWASAAGVQLQDASRRVHGTTQLIPTHATIADVDTAAALCGDGWPARLRRGRSRLTALQQQDFLGDLTRVVRDVDTRDDVDFGLLCTTAEWFRRHGHAATGLTPRQVPLPGVHAKWLNTSGHLVAEIAGLDGLHLAPGHPSRIHFTYLDAAYLARGGRRHDSATVGDSAAPAYPPEVVLISENKDTAVGFPAVAGGIAVEGAGAGGRTAAAISWLRECPTVLYWGDLDADGLAILDGYRAARIDARSILMDVATYDRYAMFGTSRDKHGSPITAGRRRELAHLTDRERELYLQLTDPAFTGHRRVEQERIPLEHALAALLLATRERS